MLKKIAVISDVHGNLEALRTVLDDIKKRNIDEIICLGDIVSKGINTCECIKLIKENCTNVIKGNWEDSLKNINSITGEIKKNRINFVLSKITNEELNYLSNLPFCHEFYMSGRLIRLFHSHPERINELIGNIDRIDRLYELFLPSKNTVSNLKADVVIYGHIHVQYMQKIYNRIILNSGSVGNSIDLYRNSNKDGNVKNTTLANYLIIKGDYNSKEYSEFSYEFVNIQYNIDKELDSNKENFEFDTYKNELLTGRYRDEAKIHEKYCPIRGIDKDSI